MLKRLIALLTALVMLALAIPSSAYAGTLTSSTFTAAGTGYTTTSAKNTRYDWGLSTATATTISRVQAGIPTGTDTYGPRYLTLNGLDGNSATTPSSPANTMGNTFDIRAKAQPSSWTSPGVFVSKWNHVTNGGSYEFDWKNDGTLILWLNGDGNTSHNISINSTASTGFAPNTAHWVRVNLVADNGSGSRIVNFYTSEDGTNWTQLGTTLTSSATTIYPSTAPLTIGKSSDNSGESVGRIYYVDIRTTIASPTTSASTCTTTGVVQCFNPADDGIQGSSWTSSSANQEVWTVNRAYSLPSDIASDLTVQNVTGLPSGGSAVYRSIDGIALYYPPSPTYEPVGTAITLSLQGFTNTSVPGSYSSLIITYDNSATPTGIDSATTSSLTFTAASNTTTVGATVDPTFTFAVAGGSTTCGPFTTTSGVTTSPTAVSFGHVSPSANAVGYQYLQVSTNAGSGWNIYLRATGGLTNGTHSFNPTPGTYASPAAFPSAGTEAFGIDSTNTMGNWGAVPTTNSSMWTYGLPYSNAGLCMGFQLGVSATTPAGSYSTTMIYTAVPTF